MATHAWRRRPAPRSRPRTRRRPAPKAGAGWQPSGPRRHRLPSQGSPPPAAQTSGPWPHGPWPYAPTPAPFSKASRLAMSTLACLACAGEQQPEQKHWLAHPQRCAQSGHLQSVQMMYPRPQRPQLTVQCPESYGHGTCCGDLQLGYLHVVQPAGHPPPDGQVFPRQLQYPQLGGEHGPAAWAGSVFTRVPTVSPASAVAAPLIPVVRKRLRLSRRSASSVQWLIFVSALSRSAVMSFTSDPGLRSLVVLRRRLRRLVG